MPTETTVRSRRSPDQWRALIAEQKEGNLRQAAFCAQHGVSVASFQYWKRRVAEVTSPSDAPAPWVELSRAVSDSHVSGGWELELELGDGVILRLKRR